MAAPNSFFMYSVLRIFQALFINLLHLNSFLNHYVEDTNKKGQHKRQWKHVSQRDDFLRCIFMSVIDVKYTTAKENVIS